MSEPPSDDDLWSRRPDPFAKHPSAQDPSARDPRQDRQQGPEPTAPYGTASYPPPAYSQQPYPQQAYPPQSYPPPYGAYGPGYAAVPPNDGLGVAAMVVGIVSLVLMCGYGVGLLGSPVALFMGRASMKRIDRSGGTLGGRGMAQAGFILGIIGTVLLVLVLAAVVFGLFALFHWGGGSTTFDSGNV